MCQDRNRRGIVDEWQGGMGGPSGPFEPQESVSKDAGAAGRTTLKPEMSCRENVEHAGTAATS
jgi:hypothetical protein